MRRVTTLMHNNKRFIKASATAFGCYYSYNWYRDCVAGRANEVHVNRESMMSELVHQIFDENPFRPTFWLRNSHAQTIVNALGTRKTEEMEITRQRIPLDDGAYSVYLDYIHSSRNVRDDGLHRYVLIIPGVFAGTQGVSVKQFVQHATDSGYHCIIMNFTSDDHKHDRTVIPGLTHAKSEDISTVVRHVRKELGQDVHLYALGISLGANLLTKYLSIHEHNHGIDAAVCLANPFDLKSTAHTLASYWSNFYDRQLLTKRKSIMDSNLHFFTRSNTQLEQEMRRELQSVESNKEFDAKFTLRLIKEKIQEEVKHIQDPDTRLIGDELNAYYVHQSSNQDVQKMNIPYLCINSKDDMISLIQSVPVEAAQENKNVAFVFTERGGHVGWLTGSTANESWVEKVSVQYFDALSNRKSTTGKSS